MPTDSERDASTDRLLRAVLRPDAAAAGPSCLDAERLAAWADGELDGQEGAAIERHLADCARCQTVLSAVVQSEPDQPAIESAPAAAAAPLVFQPRRTLRWLVPAAAGTLAATLLIWSVVRRPSVTGPPTRTTARADTPTTPPAPAPSPDQPIKMTGSPTSKTGPGAPTVSSEAAGIRSSSRTPTLSKAGGAAPPSPLPIAASPQPPPAAPGVTLASPAPPVPPANAAARTFRLGTTAGFARTDTAQASQAIEAIEVTFSSPAIEPSRSAGAAANVRSVAQAAARQVRWLVSASGKILRSSTGGATWEPVTIDPSATITGGVAPSASVCWLIGRAGVVMRSEDGFHFTRIKFPESTDLRSITAADDREATVTTTDGRTYKTNDGGATWKRGG